MTILRNLAVRITNTVVRLTAPSTQDWAAAMQRELDFVQSDWGALLWALGSIRILFQRPPYVLAALSDLPRASQRLRRKIQLRTFAGYAVVLTEAAWFTWFAFTMPPVLQKIGCTLTAIAMLFWAWQLFSRRPRAIPATPDTRVAAYRLELERQRDFFRGSWLWWRLAAVLPGTALFCYGGILAYPTSAVVFERIAGALIVLVAVAIPNSLRMARGFQRQLDELDAVLQKPL